MESNENSDPEDQTTNAAEHIPQDWVINENSNADEDVAGVRSTSNSPAITSRSSDKEPSALPDASADEQGDDGKATSADMVADGQNNNNAASEATGKDGGAEENKATKDTEKNGSDDPFFDVRVAVVGNVDSGKSTLIGVLTSGGLDNGRGLARSRIFQHRHEQENGRTSSISQHIVGFDQDDKVVHQAVSASASSVQKTASWNAVISKSRSVVTFIDLAGHEKYLKTTIAGLTGCFPDYAIVVINSLAGVSKMTREHIGVVLALKLPVIVVVTKVDMCPPNVLKATRKQLFKVLKSPQAKKMPLTIREEKDYETVIQDSSHRLTPVFWTSNTTGTNLHLLTGYLSKLRPRREWKTADEKSPVEFHIDETFSVTGVGVVISGTVKKGVMRPNTTLVMGPHSDGSYKQVFVRSIHRKRVPAESCNAGDSCALSIRSTKRKDPIVRGKIRRGMVIIDPVVNPQAYWWFTADVLVLHHPTTIQLHYQAVVHCGIIRQTAAIDKIYLEEGECLRTGDKAKVRFRFMCRPEYITKGTTFIFREGSTKGIGVISQVLLDQDIEEEAKISRSIGQTKGPRMQQALKAHRLKMSRLQQAESKQSSNDSSSIGSPSTSGSSSTASVSSSSSPNGKQKKKGGRGKGASNQGGGGTNRQGIIRK